MRATKKYSEGKPLLQLRLDPIVMDWVESHGKQEYIRSLIEYDMAVSGSEHMAVDLETQAQVLKVLQDAYEALDPIHKLLDKENPRHLNLWLRIKEHRDALLKIWTAPELREAFTNAESKRRSTL